MSDYPHRGALTVSPHLLGQALHLPPGAEIRGVEWDCMTQRLRLLVEHPDLPTHWHGCPPQPVDLEITQTTDGLGQRHFVSRFV